MKKLILLLLFITLLLPGCGAKELAETAEMTGVLYNLSDSSILVVEGIESANIPYEEWFEEGLPAISFTVDSKTEIIGLDGRATSFADLQEGQTVTVSYSGAVAESYPGQAGADRVVIVVAAPEVPSNVPEGEDDGDSQAERPVHDITDERELYQFIIPAEYTKWVKAPGFETRQPAEGPHRSEVDIYIKDIVREAL